MTTEFVLEHDASKRIRPPVFIIGLVAILAVLFFIGKALFFESGGASSPEEAVQDLAGAISNEDLAGALAALSPDEVSAISETYQAGADKAAELGLTGDGGTFGFLDLEVSDLRLDVDELGPDIAKVTIVDGRATGEFHPDRVGPKAKELGNAAFGGLVPSYEEFESSSSQVLEDGTVYESFEDGTETWTEPDAGENPTPEKGEITAADLRAEIDGESIDPFVVVVKDEGGWYVSPFHTIAEYLMLGADNDVPRPTYTKAELPPAAPTPIAAVERLVDAVNARSVDGVIDSVSADEWAVLHTYRGAIEYLLEDALGEIDPDADFKIDDIDLTAKETGDGRAVVTPKSFEAHLTVPEGQDAGWREGVEFSLDESEFDSSDDLFSDESDEQESEPTGPVTYTIEFDGKCFRVEGGEDVVDSCEMAKDLESGNIDLVPTYGFGRAPLSFGESAFDQGALEDVGIVVIAERDGWAISPLETLFGAMTAGIESITPETFAALTGTQSTLPPQAKVAMGQSTELTLNSSGFAVVGVKATKGEPFELTLDADDASVGQIVDPDGEYAGGDEFDSGREGTVEPEKTGEYRAVINGRPGSTVTVSMAAFSIPTVELGESFDVDLDGVDASEIVRLAVPEEMFVTLDGPPGLVLSEVEGEGYGSAIHLEPGDVLVQVSDDDPDDELGSGTVSIVEAEISGDLDPTEATEISVDEGDLQIYRFTAPEGRPKLRVGDDLYITLFEADSYEELWDDLVEPGADYFVMVEGYGGEDASGTIEFTAPVLGITEPGFETGANQTSVEGEWDPEYGSDGDVFYEVTLPAAEAATVTITPSAGLDVELDLFCVDGETEEVTANDAGPGQVESIRIEPYRLDHYCEVTVYGADVAGTFTVSVAPA